jgi:hypothetical protein
MLLFYCTQCPKMIAADDSESTHRIVDRLDDHIKECPSATFTCEGTSNVARRRLGDLGSSLGKRLVHRAILMNRQEIEQKKDELLRNPTTRKSQNRS